MGPGPEATQDEGAERAPATGFLLFADRQRGQRVHRLAGVPGRVVIGRGGGCDVALDWDERASRIHAELERVGGEWVLVDDGLSRNGTFVNGERVTGRRRLAHGDLIRVGRTMLAYRAGNPDAPATRAESSGRPDDALTPSQQRVLDALCAPLLEGGPGVAPATNDEIAAALHLSVDAVKGHLRVLFRAFATGDLPPSQKRLRLARSAIEAGLARPRAPRGT